MKRKRHTEEQIIKILKEAASILAEDPQAGMR